MVKNYVVFFCKLLPRSSKFLAKTEKELISSEALSSSNLHFKKVRFSFLYCPALI